MNETEILWTVLTWNPVSGCTKVSPGCKFCYAETIAENKRGTPAFKNGFDITFRPHKLREPARIKEPTLIFANSMSDFFHEEVPDAYRDQIFEAIRATPQHRFQVLTKRPEMALRYFATRQVPDNVWLGVTVEDKARFRQRVPLLRQIDARVRFLSIEPLLEDLGPLDLRGIHWAIVGGESGFHLANPKVAAERSLSEKVRGKWQAREDRKPWVRSIRDQCVAAGVAFFHKQWGGSIGPIAGRELDGRTWDEYPTVPGAMPGSGFKTRQQALL